MLNPTNTFQFFQADDWDVLSIHAGASVERLFNAARDIYHYRRGRLNAITIQELMMYLCTSKFDDKEEPRVAEP
jgi:hypothetical protein